MILSIGALIVWPLKLISYSCGVVAGGAAVSFSMGGWVGPDLLSSESNVSSTCSSAVSCPPSFSSISHCLLVRRMHIGIAASLGSGRPGRGLLLALVIPAAATQVVLDELL